LRLAVAHLAINGALLQFVTISHGLADSFIGA